MFSLRTTALKSKSLISLCRNAEISSSFRSFSQMKYLKSHEYFNMETNKIGITVFAQKQLGDVVYVDLPEVGDEIKSGEVFGSVESVKTAEDVYMPVSGKVVEINEELAEKPELVNEDPLGAGWFIKVESAVDDNPSILDEAAYTKFLEEQKSKD